MSGTGERLYMIFAGSNLVCVGDTPKSAEDFEKELNKKHPNRPRAGNRRLVSRQAGTHDKWNDMAYWKKMYKRRDQEERWKEAETARIKARRGDNGVASLSGVE